MESKELRTEIQRTTGGTELILYAEEEADLSSYAFQMLMRGAIPFLLPCRYEHMDRNLLLCYNITGMQSLLESHGKQSYRGEELRMLLEQLLMALQDMEEYLLRPEQLLLSEGMIYQDISRKRICFLFLPGYERELRTSLLALCEDILPKLDHGDRLAVHIGYSWHRLIIREETTPAEWEQLLAVPEEQERERQTESIAPSGAEQHSGQQPEARHDMDPGVSFDSADLWKESFMNSTSIRTGQEPGKLQRSGKSWERLARLAAGGILILVFFFILFLQRQGYLPDFSAEQMTGVVIVLLGLLGIVCSLTGEKAVGKGKKDPGREKKEEGAAAVPTFYEDAADKTEFSEFTAYEDAPENEVTQMIFQETPVSSGLIPLEIRPEKCYDQLYPVCFDKAHLLVGRPVPANDVKIPLRTIGRTHSRIDRDGDGYLLRDVYSMNGTYINGRRLAENEYYLLQDQDVITFAEVSYRYWKDFRKGMEELAGRELHAGRGDSSAPEDMQYH